MKFKILAFILCLTYLLSKAPASAATKETTPKETLLIGAAASLREALTEATAGFQAKHPNIKIEFNFAASSTIVRQIEAGATVDIFFSADEANMDLLAQKQLIVPTSRQAILGNELIMIVANTPKLISITKPGDLLNPQVQTLALCDEAVPIGHYAKALLTQMNLWSKIKASPNLAIVKPENVRGVLSLVQSKAADAGFVYRTDVPFIDQSLHQHAIAASDLKNMIIRYPAAVIKKSAHQQTAAALIEYWRRDPQAKQSFVSRGFKLLAP